MKLVNYTLQTQIELLSEMKSTKFFTEYIQTILEDTSKPYYQRADYIGLSINEIKTKIDFLSKDISELQTLKKNLNSALEIAKELTAKIFVENGIDRIDGSILSSLTLAKATSKTKELVSITDANAVMGLGYVKFEPDLEAVIESITSKDELEKLKEFIEITPITISTPAKIKVNAKKSSSSSISETDEFLITQEAA